MYKRVLHYLKAHKAGFISALACMVVFGATDGLVPFLVKYILDGVFTNRNEALLWILPAVIMGFAIVRAASDFGQQFLMARVGHRVTEDIRNDVNRHVLSLSPDFFVRHSTGELLSRVTSDVLLIRTLLTHSFKRVCRDTELLRYFAGRTTSRSDLKKETTN